MNEKNRKKSWEPRTLEFYLQFLIKKKLYKIQFRFFLGGFDLEQFLPFSVKYLRLILKMSALQGEGKSSQIACDKIRLGYGPGHCRIRE